MRKVFFSLGVLLVLAIRQLQVSSQGVKTTQIYTEKRPIYLKTYPTKSSPVRGPIIETSLSKRSSLKDYLARDRRVKVTINENSASYAKFENFLGVVDLLAYVISKPIAILNTIKLMSLAVSSMLMSTIAYPEAPPDFDRRKHRGKHKRGGFFGQYSGLDMDTVIEIMARNYDETLDRAGFGEEISCREKSMCILGYIVSCDFPSLLSIATRFSQNHLPRIDSQRNKYTKALAFGFNQTDCDLVYRTNYHECPTFHDYARSYMLGSIKRRDHATGRRRRRIVFER